MSTRIIDSTLMRIPIVVAALVLAAQTGCTLRGRLVSTTPGSPALSWPTPGRVLVLQSGDEGSSLLPVEDLLEEAISSRPEKFSLLEAKPLPTRLESQPVSETCQQGQELQAHGILFVSRRSSRAYEETRCVGLSELIEKEEQCEREGTGTWIGEAHATVTALSVKECQVVYTRPFSSKVQASQDVAGFSPQWLQDEANQRLLGQLEASLAPDLDERFPASGVVSSSQGSTAVATGGAFDTGSLVRVRRDDKKEGLAIVRSQSAGEVQLEAIDEMGPFQEGDTITEAGFLSAYDLLIPYALTQIIGGGERNASFGAGLLFATRFLESGPAFQAGVEAHSTANDLSGWGAFVEGGYSLYVYPRRLSLQALVGVGFQDLRQPDLASPGDTAVATGFSVNVALAARLRITGGWQLWGQLGYTHSTDITDYTVDDRTADVAIPDTFLRTPTVRLGISYLLP